MDAYTYLLIDIASLAGPLAFTWHSRIRFHQQWTRLWPGLLLVAAVFIVWDVWFTHLGVWRFNPRYVTGWNFFNLPVEEVLFFFCIPYAVLFMYHCTMLLPNSWTKNHLIISRVWRGLGLLLLAIGLFFSGKWYTFITLALGGISLLLLPTSTRFTIAWLASLLPMWIVNGLLTSLPVVIYNPTENLGLRLGTIPVEDFCYGMIFTLWNVAWMERNNMQ